MSFGSPAWLLVLLLAPLAIAAYLASQRRASRYAVRFPAVETLRIAAGEARSSWTRHLPAVLLLLAVLTLGVALAKPRTRYAVAVNNASIMLVIDHSGSMAATDVQPDRLSAVMVAANKFIDKLPQGVKLGAIGFSSTPDAVQGPVLNHGAARSLVDSEQPGGGTATGDALGLALELLHANIKGHPPSAIVLLSDGAANLGQSPVAVARQAAADHIAITTVALGTPNGILTGQNQFGVPQQVAVPPDPALMAQIAHASGGRSYNVQDAGTLNAVYAHLGEQLGSVTRQREITSEVSIVALVLLIAGVLLAVRLAGRLP